MGIVAKDLLAKANALIEDCGRDDVQLIESPPFRESRTFTTKPPSPQAYSQKKLTYRESVALLISLINTGVVLEVGSRISRSFNYQRVNFVIENGAGNDILAGGWCTFDPRPRNPSDGHFVLTELGMNAISALWDLKKLEDQGLRLLKADIQ